MLTPYVTDGTGGPAAPIITSSISFLDGASNVSSGKTSCGKYVNAWKRKEEVLRDKPADIWAGPHALYGGQTGWREFSVVEARDWTGVKHTPQ
jgi:hypothetical protein